VLLELFEHNRIRGGGINMPANPGAVTTKKNLVEIAPFGSVP
jgi:hypothetical protein